MRILSKFKDYYDSCQGMGVDETLVYLRNPKGISLTKDDADLISNIRPPSFSQHYSFDYSKLGLKTEASIIGFCGKIFPVVKFIIQTGYFENKYEYAYSYNDIIAITKRHKFKDIVKEMEQNKDNMWYSCSGGRIEEFFNISNEINKYEKFFTENKAPIFCVELNHEKLNDDGHYIHPTVRQVIQDIKLSDFGFVKIVDPFTAYQELSMYIGGVLGVNAPEMIEISDKMMRDKKGFNNISFKKVPDNRKRKQKTGKIKKKFYKD